jgi:hypothetical protein
MKKYITTFLMAAMLAVMIPAMTVTSLAQTRSCNSNSRNYRSRSREAAQYYNESPSYNDGNYDNSGYYDNGTYRSGQPNVYDRHRKAINIGGGAAAGAVIGAIIGGRKGALIGAGAGAVGGVIVTKKQRPRNYYPY